MVYDTFLKWQSQSGEHTSTIFFIILLLLNILYARISDNNTNILFFRDPQTRLFNAKRQLYVNDLARGVGSGVGTADYEGVPGSHFDDDFDGSIPDYVYDRYGHGGVSNGIYGFYRYP